MNKPFSSRTSETDWERVAAMSDEDIDLSEIPEATAEQVAQVSKWQGDLEAARGYYAIAAEAESQAVAALEPGKEQTLGITVVSAVALWFKAQEFSKAKMLAYEWLASGQLPGFAIAQVEEILKEILVLEASAVAV